MRQVCYCTSKTSKSSQESQSLNQFQGFSKFTSTVILAICIGSRLDTAGLSAYYAAHRVPVQYVNIIYYHKFLDHEWFAHLSKQLNTYKTCNMNTSFGKIKLGNRLRFQLHGLCNVPIFVTSSWPPHSHHSIIRRRCLTVFFTSFQRNHLTALMESTWEWGKLWLVENRLLNPPVGPHFFGNSWLKKMPSKNHLQNDGSYGLDPRNS